MQANTKPIPHAEFERIRKTVYGPAKDAFDLQHARRGGRVYDIDSPANCHSLDPIWEVFFKAMNR